MTITRNKLFSSIIISAMILCMLTVSVFATTYTSSLSMSFRSTATGADRSYIGNTHAMSATLSTRDNPGTTDNYCDVYLQRKSGFSYSTTGIDTLNLITIGNAYGTTFNGQVDGTHRYYFSSIYAYNDYRYTKVDGFTSNLVVMSSW